MIFVKIIIDKRKESYDNRQKRKHGVNEMNKEQENTLRAIKTGEQAKAMIVNGGGIKSVTQGMEKSYNAKRALEIVNMAENNTSLQLQKAAQAQRA